MSKEIASIIVSGSNALHGIAHRTVSLDKDRFIRSLDVNQTDGSFVTTETFENEGQIHIYPQSPNNPLYESNTYKNFASYGNIKMPTDARFDFVRRKMWISDTGNSNVIKVEINDFYIEKVIENIILPCVVVPEINIGGVFIRGFSGINTGTIYYYKANGDMDDCLEFPCVLGRASTDLEFSEAFVNGLPPSSSVKYDHIRWRLWWVSGTYVYMMDVRNRQVNAQDLGYDFSEIRGVDIDFETGNAMIVAKGEDLWFVVQVFRDNNCVLGKAYIEKAG